MHKEIDFLERYNTWQQVLAPEGTQFVDTKCCWVLNKTRDEKQELIKYKACLND